MTKKKSKEVAHITDQHVIDDILEQMSKGVPPWRMPWTDSLYWIVIGSMKYLAPEWPSNVRAPLVLFGVYNGIVLLTHARTQNYRTNLWVSDRVVNGLKAELASSDEHPVAITNFDELGNRMGKRLVYNIDQVKDCEKALGLTLEEVQRVPPMKEYEKSEKLLHRLKEKRHLKIKHYRTAAYSPSFDVVLMPAMEKFNLSSDGTIGDAEGLAHYWATLWHEVIHWTGHPSRLNRKRHREWGDQIYAFEELVAELGSAFLCAHLDIDGKLQHASYLDSWYRQLKREQREEGGRAQRSLITASILASAAKDFVLRNPAKDSKTQSA